MSTKYLSIFCVFSFFHQCLIGFTVFTSLVKLIPRYFILFDAILNRIVFLLSLSDSSLLVYRKARFLYVNLVTCNFTECIY